MIIARIIFRVFSASVAKNNRYTFDCALVD